MTAVWFLAGFATVTVCWVAASCLWGPRTPRGRGGYIDISRATKTRSHDWERSGDLYEPSLSERGNECRGESAGRTDGTAGRGSVGERQGRQPRSLSDGEPLMNLWEAIQRQDLQAVVDEANREGAA